MEKTIQGIANGTLELHNNAIARDMIRQIHHAIILFAQIWELKFGSMLLDRSDEWLIVLELGF